MPEDDGEDALIRRIDVVDLSLAFLERVSPRLSEGLRDCQRQLDLDLRLKVFCLLQRLVRGAPDEAWYELLEHPERFVASPRSDQRWFERLALRHLSLYGVETREIIHVVSYVETSAMYASAEKNQEKAAALNLCVTRIVETVAFLMRFRVRQSALHLVQPAEIPFEQIAENPLADLPGADDTSPTRPDICLVPYPSSPE